MAKKSKTTSADSGLAMQVAGNPVLTQPAVAPSPELPADHPILAAADGTPGDLAHLRSAQSGGSAGAVADYGFGRIAPAGNAGAGVAAPDDKTDDTPEVPSVNVDTGGLDAQIAHVKQLIAEAEAERETPEQKQKRERRERAKKIIAAVGDGLSAMGSLYAASKGVRPAYGQGASVLDGVNGRIEQARQAREANDSAYTQYVMKYGDLIGQKAETVRQAEENAIKMRLLRAENERKAAEEARAAEEHQWKKAWQADLVREKAAKATKAEYDAAYAAFRAQGYSDMQAAKLATEYARARAANAAAGASDAAAVNSLASAEAHNRSNPYEYTAVDANGNVYKFKDKKAADNFAKQNGTYVAEVSQETSVKTDERNQQSTAVKTKPNGGYAKGPNTQKSTGLKGKWK